MVGLCLVAVFAMGAVAATSASALPEWGKCEKLGTKTGAYTDANCTVKAKPLNTGEFKFIKGKELPAMKFSGENIGSGGVLKSAFLSCEGGKYSGHLVPRKKCVEGGGTVSGLSEPVTIECESERNTGEANGTNEVRNVNVKFLGCKVFGSAPCSNGPNTGEITVNPLKGKLGYINKAGKEVGLLLEPAKKHGEFAKFNCAGIITTVVGQGNTTEGAYYLPETTGGYDGIISPITPVNTQTTKFKQVYAMNPTTFANIPSKFEGKHIELLEDYIYGAEEPETNSDMWSPAGEEITNENTVAEPREIKG
jgi:hypothetical protein